MDPATKLYLAKFRIAERHREADEGRLARIVRARTSPLIRTTFGFRRLQLRSPQRREAGT